MRMPPGNEQSIIGKYAGPTTTATLVLHYLFSFPFCLPVFLGGIWVETHHIKHSLFQQIFIVHLLSDTLSVYFKHQNRQKQKKTTTRPLEWLKSRTLTPPNAGKAEGQQELSCIAVGMWMQRPFRKSLAVSYKAKHIVTIPSSNCAPLHLPKGDETYATQKPAHTCL